MSIPQWASSIGFSKDRSFAPCAEGSGSLILSVWLNRFDRIDLICREEREPEMTDMNTMWMLFLQQMGGMMRVMVAGSVAFVGGWAMLNALPLRQSERRK